MFEKLKSYAARQLELDPSEITPDSTFESLGIDSLDVDVYKRQAWALAAAERILPPPRTRKIPSAAVSAAA